MNKSKLLLMLIFSLSFIANGNIFPVGERFMAKSDPICADFFSPNGDGHNDFFIIKNLDEFPINKLFVFNRWGESVYTAEPYKNDWDGTMNIEHPLFGDTLPEGMYFYRFEFYAGDFLSKANGKIILKR